MSKKCSSNRLLEGMGKTSSVASVKGAPAEPTLLHSIFTIKVSIFYYGTGFLLLQLAILDPYLYPNLDKNTFKLNVVLKYSILEDVISIIIFKCTMQVRI